MARALKALIDCAALRHNLNRVKAAAPGCAVMAMVKANGYGHGIVTVAKSLETADAYGVACIEEATQLIQAGITKPIVLMEGFFEAAELPDIWAMNLQLVIHHEKHLKELQNFHATGRQISVWIKINTGMNRLGFPVSDFQGVLDRVQSLAHVKVVGILTHFARADELTHPETTLQISRFIQALKAVHQTVVLSVANSAGILGWPDCLKPVLLDFPYTVWVRPGLILYGASPFEGRIGAEEGLKPVMTLASELIAIQRVRAGEAVGYGGTYTAPKDSFVGIVAIGYGDGYPRLMPTGTPVLVNGVRVPLVGRVSMDMLSVDLSLLSKAKIGDPVQLWGPELPVEEIAARAGTTAYELLTGLSSRVPCQAYRT